MASSACRRSRSDLRHPPRSLGQRRGQWLHPGHQTAGRCRAARATVHPWGTWGRPCRCRG